MGARPMARVIQEHIKRPLAEELLFGRLSDGGHVRISIGIYAELGFAPPLARGLFCLSRSVGILSHAWEQTCQGGRNKGPIPRDYPITYRGRKRRNLKLNEE